MATDEPTELFESDEEIPLKLLGIQRRDSASKRNGIEQPPLSMGSGTHHTLIPQLIKEPDKIYEVNEKKPPLQKSKKIEQLQPDVTETTPNIAVFNSHSGDLQKSALSSGSSKEAMKATNGRSKRAASVTSKSDSSSESSSDSSGSLSSSDQSSSSSVSNSEDEKPLKAVFKKGSTQNAVQSIKANAMVKKPSVIMDKEVIKPLRSPCKVVKGAKQEAVEASDDKEEVSMRMSSFNPSLRSKKDKLVSQLLVRWWYALPEWPPKDYDYTPDLEKRKLKCVSIEEWEDLEDIDENGYTKVYQISAFPGVFRNPQGNAIDLRCRDTCPSYSNFIKKSELELLQLIQKSLSNQLEKLKSSPYDESKYRENLLHELSDINRQLREHERKLSSRA